MQVQKMGCCTSMTQTKQEKKSQTLHFELSALRGFMKGEGNLQKIWDQFDKDHNGFMDAEEFRYLIECSVRYVWYCDMNFMKFYEIL